MWGKLKSIERKLVRLEEEFVIFVMLLLVVLQLMQVLFRYVLKNPLAWIDEASSILLIWLTMIGSAVGVQKMAHFSERFLVEKLPKHFRTINYFIVIATNLAFLFLLLIYSYMYIQSVKDQVTPATGLPIEVLDYSLPVGVLLMIYHLLMNIDKYMKGGRETTYHE